MRKILTLVLLAVTMTAAAEKKADPWKEAEKIVKNIKQTKFPKYEVSITQYGALANKPEALCHDAINKAILETSLQGGGTVIIPDSTYYTGPIRMKSNVRLHLADGATLKFSTDIKYYYPAVLSRWEGVDCYLTHPLIYAYGETNIALTGKGTLDAQGQKEGENWWYRQKAIERSPRKVYPNDPYSPEKMPSRLKVLLWGENEEPMENRIFDIEDALRPPFINFYHCSTVLIEDLTIKSSPFWVIHPLLSNDIIVRGVTVDNHGPNGDGCDPESCKNVLIENCTFNTGDDCIAIKSGRNADGRKWNIPSENIVVRNCHMMDGHGGIVIGSEISGGYKNLYVENCTMDSPNLDRVVRIKTSNCRGGIIEGIHIRNIKVGECGESVVRINLNYEPKENCNRAFPPQVRNVSIENITCEKSQYGLYLSGFDDVTNIYDISLKNCHFTGVKTGTNFSEGLIGNVTLDNVTINGKPLTEIKSGK